ncbi:MAG: diaminopimelate epimerase [Moheibacter sp.]
MKIQILTIPFFKYQGAGNDFVMVDDRNRSFSHNPALIRRICDRHFGIGADGLILLQDDAALDFNMVYFNSDGHPSSMCGNGGRCVVRFANKLGIIQKETEFNAIDGSHQAVIDGDLIRLKMSNIPEVISDSGFVFLNTGSPHHVEFVSELSQLDVKSLGAQIRHGPPYFEEGTNVNFVEITGKETLRIRTYERGVEDETLACGTGVTAAAIAAFESGLIHSQKVEVKTLGGNLSVEFERNLSGGYENIWLTGPAEYVFEGELTIIDKF